MTSSRNPVGHKRIKVPSSGLGCQNDLYKPQFEIMSGLWTWLGCATLCFYLTFLTSYFLVAPHFFYFRNVGFIKIWGSFTESTMFFYISECFYTGQPFIHLSAWSTALQSLNTGTTQRPPTCNLYKIFQKPLPPPSQSILPTKCCGKYLNA